MKILLVRPGPKYSVEDVANGWVKGLRAVGHEVIDWDLGTRIAFFDEAFRAVRGDDAPILEQILYNATSHLEAACWEYNPDVVLLITGLLVPSIFYEMARQKHFVALVATESPYEDGIQLELAKHCDMVILNDNRNITKFGQYAPSHYYGHGFDSDIHNLAQPADEYKSDFCFIGSFYKERIDILEKVNFDGIKTILGGDHRRIKKDSPLAKYLVNPIDKTIKNFEAAEYYKGAKVGANIYRQENNYSSDGNSCGPREIEQAACGMFFLREHRPESDSLFWMLPTFDGPQDLEQKIRYWLKNSQERNELAALATKAVQHRSFENIAAAFTNDLLKLI